jgi:hypothetical protein
LRNNLHLLLPQNRINASHTTAHTTTHGYSNLLFIEAYKNLLQIMMGDRKKYKTAKKTVLLGEQLSLSEENLILCS